MKAETRISPAFSRRADDKFASDVSFFAVRGFRPFRRSEKSKTQRGNAAARRVPAPLDEKFPSQNFETSNVENLK